MPLTFRKTLTLTLILLPLHLYASTLLSSEEDDDIKGTQMRLLTQTVQTGQDCSKNSSMGELQELSLAEPSTAVSRKPNVSTPLLSDPESLRQKSRPPGFTSTHKAFLLLDTPFELVSIGLSTYNLVNPSSLLLKEEFMFMCTVALTRTLAAFMLLKPQDVLLRGCFASLIALSLGNCIITSTILPRNGSTNFLPFLIQCVFEGPIIITLYAMIRLQNYNRDEYDLCCRDHECNGE